MCAERQRLAGRAMWALVAGLLGMYLVLFALVAAGRLARPADEFTYGESWLLDGARHVALGQGLYGPADEVPMMHVAYTPGYYVVVGVLQRLVGDHGYTVGRTVSLVATLIGAGALAWSLRRMTTATWVGLLGGAIFLTQNLTLLLWGPLQRVDPLALALTLVGMACVTAGRHRIAAVLFVTALFTKQSYIVAPLATAISLWPDRRRLAWFVGTVGGLTVVGVLFAQWLTHGWFLWHTVTANSNEPDLTTFATLIGSFMQYNGLLTLAAAASLSLASSPCERVWRLYFLGSLLTLPSVAKLGASSNYWLELTAATPLLLALASHRLAMWPATRLVAPTILAGALMIAVPAYQATAVEVAANVADVLQPSWPRYLSLVSDSSMVPFRVDEGFVERISREPGELLTDNSGLAVAAGKRIAFEFQIFQLLAVEGHWSEAPILEAIAEHRFALVALMHSLDAPAEGTRLTPAVHSALANAYTLESTDGGFWLYRPRR